MRQTTTIITRITAAGILALALLTGCDRTPADLAPDKLILFSPETVLCQPGAYLTNAVRVELLSKAVPGLLGGKGTTYPVAGHHLIARPVGNGDSVTATPDEAVTDAGGVATFHIEAGHAFGDHYLEITSTTRPDIRAQVRFVIGLRVDGNAQELTAGAPQDQPFTFHLTDREGRPLPDVPLYFSLVRQPGKGGALSSPMARTDTDGRASVTLKTAAGATGRYEVLASVAAPERNLFLRPVAVEAMAMSLPHTAVVVLGGLALFIFGMTLMSEGLHQVAGNRMRAFLAYITRNRVAAIFAGTLVTALIQSSSATSVMTVGFVNAGLLSLKQAIGVIFGANIGTTVTGQMVSFKLDGLALPAVILGVLGVLTLRKAAWQGAARTVLGFGLLFFGMGMMSGALKNVSSFPTFIAFFRTFDCTPAGGVLPLGAVLGAIGIGTLMTMLVQSSSATIGLTIVLANSGLLNIWTAIPIVLGDNIGTTITAILASASANRTARQTAAAHAMFNVLGTCVMVALFYVPFRGIPCFFHLVNTVTAGNAFLGENVGRHVAMAHTLFNVANVILMTPFIGALAWLCETIIPNRDTAPKTVQLETHLLSSPPLALFCAMRALGEMVDVAWDCALLALRGYKEDRPVDIEKIERIEDQVDAMQKEIVDYIVRLSRHELTEKQAGSIPVLVHCVNDAERIADLALLIARRAASQQKAPAPFSDTANQELDALFEAVVTIAALTRESLQDGRFLAKAVEAKVHEADVQANAAIQNHVRRLQGGTCSPERGMVFVEVVTAAQNIVRHLENIAQRSDTLTEAATR